MVFAESWEKNINSVSRAFLFLFVVSCNRTPFPLLNTFVHRVGSFNVYPTVGFNKHATSLKGRHLKLEVKFTDIISKEMEL